MHVSALILASYHNVMLVSRMNIMLMSTNGDDNWVCLNGQKIDLAAASIVSWKH